MPLWVSGLAAVRSPLRPNIIGLSNSVVTKGGKTGAGSGAAVSLAGVPMVQRMLASSPNSSAAIMTAVAPGVPFKPDPASEAPAGAVGGRSADRSTDISGDTADIADTADTADTADIDEGKSGVTVGISAVAGALP